MEGGTAGILIGAARLAWYPDPYRVNARGTWVSKNLGTSYILRNMRAPVLWSAMVCGVFSAVECVMENLRDEAKESTYVNATVAGAAAGMVMGSLTRRIDIMATSALGVGLLSGMIEFNGQRYAADQEHAHTKWHEVLPPETKETTTVLELKEKYPEFKGL